MTVSSPQLWERPPHPPASHPGTTHIWRINLLQTAGLDAYLPGLSPHEQERALRFYFPHHRVRFAVAHAVLRQILATYLNAGPLELEFTTGEHGKPALRSDPGADRAGLHFNLSHSGDVALLAVSHHGPVGVDVEYWRDGVEHLEIAERFFSPYERDALRRAAQPPLPPQALVRAFFSTWSRKEAYLKATGHGISRGLQHFDVTADIDGEPTPYTALLSSPTGIPLPAARIIADRLDPGAPGRWALTHIDPGPHYSAALVTERLPDGGNGAVRLFDAPHI